MDTSITSTRTTLWRSLIAVGATVASLSLTTGAAHAATVTIKDPNEKGVFGDMSALTYKAGWYWNKVNLKFYGKQQQAGWYDIDIDTDAHRRGPEFIVPQTDESIGLSVYKTAAKNPWVAADGHEVCYNDSLWYGDVGVTFKFGTGCLRNAAGKLPTRVRIRVTAETDSFTNHTGVDYLPAKATWTRWFAVAKHP